MPTSTWLLLSQKAPSLRVRSIIVAIAAEFYLNIKGSNKIIFLYKATQKLYVQLGLGYPNYLMVIVVDQLDFCFSSLISNPD